MENPLSIEPLFHLGPVPVTAPVVVTWVIMAVLAALAWATTRRLTLRPGKAQTVLELMVTTIDAQIADTMRRDPAPWHGHRAARPSGHPAPPPSPDAAGSRAERCGP